MREWDCWWSDDGGDDDDDAALAAEWAFVEKHWSWQLHRRLDADEFHRQDAAAVRIGRDECDWWLDVDAGTGCFVRRNDVGDSDDEMRRIIREGVMMLHVVAHADYGSWIALLRDVEFESAPFMNLKYGRLPPQFAFNMSGLNDISWATTSRHLFGTEDLSDDFRRDLEEADRVYREQGHDLATIPPITTKLCFGPGRLQRSVALRAVERRRYDPDLNAGDRSVVPVFSVKCIELLINEFTLNSAGLKRLIEVLEKGVTIHTLELPGVAVDYYEYTLKLDTWADFLLTLFGQRTAEKHPPTAVNKLVVPPSYMVEGLFAPFCSVLATARGVDRVCLRGGPLFQGPGREQQQLWRWLGFAMFSSASRNSVTTLEINGQVLTRDQVQGLVQMATVSTPLVPLLSPLSLSPPLPLQAQHIDLPKGIVLDIKTVRPTIHPEPVKLGGWTDGVVLQSDSTTMVLFIPGFGICSVDPSTIPHKRRRAANKPLSMCEDLLAQTTRPLRDLVVKMKSDQAGDEGKAALVELLQAVGGSLTGLSVHLAGLDDRTCQEMISACSSLTSLRLSGAHVDSLGWLVQGYQRGRVAISSLDLVKTRIPPEALDSFLCHLLDTPIVGSTLQRLRLGHRWPAPVELSSLEIIADILDENATMTHIQIATSEPGVEQLQEAHHGQALEILKEPLPLASRRAFLGVLLRCRRHQTLSEDLLRQIFDLAATPDWRRVQLTSYFPRPHEDSEDDI